MLHQTNIIADPLGLGGVRDENTKHVVFVVQNCEPMYAVKGCLELLKLANKFCGQIRYRFGIVRDVESAFSTGSDLSKQTVILFGSIERPWNLNDRSARLVRTHLPCSERIGLVGGAVLISSHIPHLRSRSYCIHSKFTDAANEQAIRTVSADIPAVQDGKVHSATGELAALHMVGAMIANDCGEFLAQQVLSHIGLNASSVDNRSEAENQYYRMAKGNPMLTRAISMMKQNAEEPLCLERLSDSLDASTRKLQRNFRKCFGETPMAVYLNIRLERAYHLLKFTDLPIDEVSVATGFTSRSQFTLRFRNKFNITPIRCRATRYQR